MALLLHFSFAIFVKLPFWNEHCGLLILAAQLLDIITMIFYLFGLEFMPQNGIDVVQVNPGYTHGLMMALVWSILYTFLVYVICRNVKRAIVHGATVFSHFVIDFITHPMSFMYPDVLEENRMKIPLFFENYGPKISGLDLYNESLKVNIIESGSLVISLCKHQFRFFVHLRYSLVKICSSL